MGISYFTLSMFVKSFVGNFLVQGLWGAKSATEGDRQGAAAACSVWTPAALETSVSQGRHSDWYRANGIGLNQPKRLAGCFVARQEKGGPPGSSPCGFMMA